MAFDPTITVTSLAGVLAALVLALEGAKQRKENRAKVDVVCPPAVAANMAAAAAAAAATRDLAEDAVNRLDRLEDLWDEETKAWLRGLRDAHAAVDANGVFRWYGRDQGAAILAALEELRRQRESDARRVETAIRDLSGHVQTLEAIWRGGGGQR